MSENVELVARAMDAINRADIDALAAEVTDDFDLDFSNSRGPMSGTYRGPDEMRDFLSSFFEPWATFEFEPEEVIELDGERVLVVTQVRSRGHGSGAPVSARGANIWTIRDDKVAAVKLFQSKEEALEAASAQR